MGPSWHLESALQMLWMRSDSSLDVPVSGAEEMPRGSVQASAVAALPSSMRELHPQKVSLPGALHQPLPLWALASFSVRWA